MSKINKTCSICGNGYNYCAKCEKKLGFRFYADTPSCYQIFSILRDNREGVLSTVEAKKMFENIGVTSASDMSNILSSVARDIKAIISVGAVSIKKTK